MTLPILIHPDPRLRKVAEPVERIDDGLRKLIADMFETMYQAPGIGLAAPQIGIGKRLVVMDCAGREDMPPDPICLINPRIVESADALAENEEGCLSIPDVFAPVTRPEAVTVAWTDPDGSERQAEWQGIRATCVQHEIDHLNGKLFIDYLSPMRRQLITSKMKKLKRERARAAASAPG